MFLSQPADPKALEMAGEVADGVILFGAVGDSLLEYALQHVRKGAEKSGRTMDDIYVMLSTAAACLRSK